MNITVIGAGAIGGHIAARLAAAGESVKVVARGAHLKAIRERGLILKEDGEEITARVEATDRIAEAGGADLIVLAVKAHQLTPIAADVASIVKPATTVMTTQNGIPWWYFLKHGGPYEGHRLESVDPGGVIADHLRRAKDRTHRGFVGALHARRLQVAGASRRADRNLDQALG